MPPPLGILTYPMVSCLENNLKCFQTSFAGENTPNKGWGLLASALLLALPSTLQGPTSPPSWSVPFMAVKTFTSPGNIFRCVHISSTYSRQLVGPSIRAYVGHTFRFPLIVSLDRRPRDMIYFLKAMTNSFYILILKVYFLLMYFLQSVRIF